MTLTRRKALLESIGSTESSSFNEFLRALDEEGEVPTAGKTAWAKLFADLKELEDEGCIEIDRILGKVSELILTEQGVRALKELRERSR